MKVLILGNSFSEDTMTYLPHIAKSHGLDLCCHALLRGGCSLSQHYDILKNAKPWYMHTYNTDTQWHSSAGIDGNLHLTEEKWDYLILQHGTGDGGYYTDPDSYRDLPSLLAYLRDRIGADPTIVFNLTWLGERGFDHHQLHAYADDPHAAFADVLRVTQQTVLPQVDRLCPAGTAIFNARTSRIPSLHRDKWHLTLDTGRYLAALTMFHTLTGTAVSASNFVPNGVDAYHKAVATEAARNAVAFPFVITPSKL